MNVTLKQVLLAVLFTIVGYLLMLNYTNSTIPVHQDTNNNENNNSVATQEAQYCTEYIDIMEDAIKSHLKLERQLQLCQQRANRLIEEINNKHTCNNGICDLP